MLRHMAIWAMRVTFPPSAINDECAMIAEVVL
jgi:hypothetical protein